jgi:hypothetical protein
MRSSNDERCESIERAVDRGLNQLSGNHITARNLSYFGNAQYMSDQKEKISVYDRKEQMGERGRREGERRKSLSWCTSSTSRVYTLLQ